MKLNPPETAPKDGTEILAIFDDGQYLHSAVWNNSSSVWMVAFGLDTGYFAVCPFPSDSLSGWLPMPEIDNEGTVTWPSASPA